MKNTATKLMVRGVRLVSGDDEGASLVEYALLVALIALVAVIAITAFGVALSDEYDSIATNVPG